MAIKKFIQALCFFILILLKVSSAPIFLHDCHDDDHIDDCDICELAILNQNTEFTSPPQFQNLEVETLCIPYQHDKSYESITLIQPIVAAHFGRPPPTS